MDYLLLLLGFALLIKGADIFVNGASSIAKIFKVPSLVIGLTIVAFGTSAPELAVSVTSALNGQNGIAVGNVVGSNIFNILMVIGCAAMLSPLKVEKEMLLKEIPLTMLSGVVLLILSLDTVLNTSASTLSRGDGLILLAFFGIFMYSIMRSTSSNRTDDSDSSEATNGILKSIAFTVLGLIGIVLGGDIVVDSASSIATSLGMSEALVGLTIVAIGTSLPELVTSVVAARKGQSEIALGNVIGSCIFNVFFILGISATITPIALNPEAIIDMFIMIATIFVMDLFASRKTIGKKGGLTLFLMYCAYMAYIILR